MTERWVLNASPIISLARVDGADLLVNIPDECVVPQPVFDEVMAGPESDPARIFLQGHQSRVVVVPQPTPEILGWDLGDSETAVLSFALANPGFIAILDDFAARKCASSFSIPVKRMLAVVIIAKQRGLVRSASEVLRSLQSAGFHLDDRVIAKALFEMVGEVWGK